MKTSVSERHSPAVNFKSFRHAMLSSVAISALALASPAYAQKADKWVPHVDIVAKPGTERHLGETELFWPLFQNDTSMVFTDIRGFIDDDNNKEGNFALGYRSMIGGGWILGAFGSFDVRGTENKNTFYQGTLGLEALTEDLDLRANLYIPEGGKQAAPVVGAAVFSGATVSVRPGFERALWGFDAEVGYRLPFDIETRVYVGGFYFDAKDAKTVAGPRARFETRLYEFAPGSSRITIGGEIQYDKVRKTDASAMLRFRIPLGFGNYPSESQLSALDRRMVDPIRRDPDIVSGSFQGAPEAAINPETGQQIGELKFVDNSTGGTGTLEDPQNFNGQHFENNDLIVVIDKTGDVANAQASLKDGQILAGGGTPITLIGVGSGQRVTGTLPGTAPKLLQGGSSRTAQVTLANGNTVRGLTFEGGEGIRSGGDTTGTTTLKNLRFTSLVGSDKTGIKVDGGETGKVGNRVGNVTIRNVITEGVDGAEGNKIEVKNFNTASVHEITGDGSGNKGFDLKVEKGNVATVGSVTVEGGEGKVEVKKTEDITVTNISITGNGNKSKVKVEGAEGGTSTATVSNVTVEGAEGKFELKKLASGSVSNVTVRTQDGHDTKGGVKIEDVFNTTLSDVNVEGGEGVFTKKSIVTLNNFNVTKVTNGQVAYEFEDGQVSGTGNLHDLPDQVRTCIFNGMAAGPITINDIIRTDNAQCPDPTP